MRQPKPRHVARKRPAVAPTKPGVARKKPAVAQRTAIPATQDADTDSPVRQTAQILETWRGQLLARGFDVSPHFLAGDITDAGLLCRQLTTRTIWVAKFVWKELGEETQLMVDRASKASEVVDKTREALAGALNRLIGAPESDKPMSGGHSGTIWNKARFSGIRLSDETKDLLKRQPRPGSMGLILLNRFLLADAFPKALNRVPQDPSNFSPYGHLFPARVELEQFDDLLKRLAASAGLKEVTSKALERIDKRQPSLFLLEILQLAVQRLARVPKNPRLQIVASVLQGTAETQRSVHEALTRLRDAGMSLDSTWHRDLNLEAILRPGVSDGLVEGLSALREELPEASLSKEAQRSLTRLANHAVFTDLFARSALWDHDHAEVRPFCQWLQSLYDRDIPGFVRHLLAGDESLLHHINFLHWQSFTPPEVAAREKARRRQAQNREQKERKRLVQAQSSGRKFARRRRVVPHADVSPLAPDSPDWFLVV